MSRKKKVNTPYDDIFHTLVADCPKLTIPVINELFRENYTDREKITLLQNEQYIQGLEKEPEKRITDSCIGILNKIYHFECQCNPDGTILFRMFQYDSQIALNSGDLKNNVLTVNFPHGAVLYLRHYKNTPDNMQIVIQTPGSEASYKIPVLKVQEYDLREIFEKKLYFLLPFYIFHFEKTFADMEKDEEKRKELGRVFRKVFMKLENLCHKGRMDEYTKNTIIELSRMAAEHLTEKYAKVHKEVEQIMGGRILEYEAKTIKREGIQEGIQKGMREGLRAGKQKGLREGMRKGSHQGEARAFQLYQHLAREGRTDELSRAAVDEKFRKKLYREFGL